MPRRATLSSYAGPMPRPVVPMALPPAAFSRAWSRAMWYGMISGVAGLIFRRGRTSTPLASSSSISLRSAAGLSTTPLPIRHSASGRRMPDGIRCRTVFTPLMTSVWPALWPPWKRTTAWAWSVSQSTTLPLPSSPHWVPTTTTFRPPALCCSMSLRLMRLIATGLAGAHRPGAAPADELAVAFEFLGLVAVSRQHADDGLALLAESADGGAQRRLLRPRRAD